MAWGSLLSGGGGVRDAGCGRSGCPRAGRGRIVPVAPLGEDAAQAEHVVGDDAVDPRVEQPPHDPGVVDGPHVHLHPQPVGGGDEVPAEQGETVVGRRDLRARHPAACERAQCRRERRQAQPRDVDRPARGRHRVVEAAPRPLQPPLVEGAHAHPVPRAGAAQYPLQRADRAVGLEVDVEPRLGPGAEQVLKDGDGFAAADPGASDLGVGQVGDGAGAVGGAVERGVVEREEDTVGGGVHVGLQVAVPEADRVPERGRGVLQFGAHPPGGIGDPTAPVGQCDGGGRVEVCRSHNRSMPGRARTAASGGPDREQDKEPDRDLGMGPGRGGRRCCSQAKC
ncbi:hypothetical protein CLV63_10651 [Murinocardiopsis flavida]|uniref:Uncharacterized protein n=1 Tax=Murinocardiopsis flavida TaxID=645275 RepID=A0A2P8DLA6_9ACTN|nr:hypothetical protein CLV63_10651 [Murinocardiopsis flavida]